MKKATSEVERACVVTFGTAMFEEAKPGLVRDKDETRMMPIERQKRLRRPAARKISGVGEVLFDTHLLPRTG